MGPIGKRALIVPEPTGSDQQFAGMIGVIVNIAPDSHMYYIEFEEIGPHWVHGCSIFGVQRVQQQMH